MIIFPGGCATQMEFPEGWGGVHCVSKFWKIQRGWGVIGKIPSVGGYGYFLELHIVHSSLATNQTGTISLAQHE